MHIGTNAAGDITTPGTVAISTTNPATVPVNSTHAAYVDIGSSGTFTLGDSEQFQEAMIDCAGVLQLGVASTIDTVPNVPVGISGGVLQMPNTVGAKIHGDLIMGGGALLLMGDGQGTYSNLQIDGNLKMTNTTVSIDVNANSLTECDTIAADNSTIDATDSVNVFTNGATLPGQQDYNVLSGGPLTGLFGPISWLGGNPIGWTPEFLPNDFELTGSF